MHKQPGPQIMAGGVQFNLWAPSANSVAWKLHDSDITFPMETEDGWYTVFVPGATAGTLYNFQIDGNLIVPDPASAFQPQDVDGPSEVIDFSKLPAGPAFQSVPWPNIVIYEAHVGTFTPEGTYQAAEGKLDHLVSVGFTALQLMPLNDVPGQRNWGYDGVLLNAPNSAYGRPEDLKHLINAAHAHGLMVFLDVVYNHFGPAANYLGTYAPQFFHATHTTGWGPALNLEDEHGRHVRDFLINNGLQWVRDYEVDGLRLDAVHALKDESPVHFIKEFAETIRTAAEPRPVYIMLENEYNEAKHLMREEDGTAITAHAQWGDDFHNSLHVLLTGEKEGYYEAFADKPLRHLARSLSENFAYQGEIFPLTGEPRGEPGAGLPPDSTIFFLQNHDQIGNRARGERLSTLVSDEQLRQGMALLLLNPHIPLLFMGEEARARSPFLFFCDWTGELAEATRKGRAEEFAAFTAYTGTDAELPDAMEIATFELSKIDWQDLQGAHNAEFLQMTKTLLHLRQTHVVPLIYEGFNHCETEILTTASGDELGLIATWHTQKGKMLRIAMNFSEEALDTSALAPDNGQVLWNTHPERGLDRLHPHQLIVAAS